MNFLAMKHLILLFALLAGLSCCQLPAQGLLPGLITEQNSDNTPIAGIPVSTDVGGSTETATDGTFLLKPPGKQVGYQVLVEVEKAGWEVVNKKELLTTLKADSEVQLKLYMCPRGRWHQEALSFYEINEKEITKKYRNRINGLQTALVSNQQLLADTLARAREEYDWALKEAERLSFDFAKANLDDATRVYREAYKRFVAGDLDGALEILRIENPTGKLLQEQQTKKKLNERLVLADSIIQEQIKNTILKARLHQANSEFDSAAYCFEIAVGADSLDVDLNFEYAVFLQKQNWFIPAAGQYQYLLELTLDSSQIATVLNNLGLAHKDQHHYTKTISTLEEALKIRRKLALTHPEVYLPEVAGTLNNLGNTLTEQHDYAKAILLLKEALKINRKLALTHPEVYLPEVAGTLNNMGNTLTDQYDYIKAILVYEEALNLFRKSAESYPDVYLPHMSTILNNLGIAYSERNDHEKSLSAYKESLTLRRKLASSNPDVYLPDVAATLNNLSAGLIDQNDYVQGIPARKEALYIYRKLAEANPSVYLPYVATTLTNLGNVLAKQNDYAKGIPVYEEALRIRRKLAETYPEVYLPDVASTLNNLGYALIALKNHEKGVSFYKEALKIRRKLALVNPEVFSPKVAETLNNLGLALTDQNITAKSIPAYEEALNLFRKLAEADPSVYLPDVAATLNNLGMALITRNDYKKGIPTYEEALEIRRKLAQTHPKVYLPDLATTLNNLGVALTNQNHHKRGIFIHKEALKIRRKLAENNPEVYLSYVATTLNNLGVSYWKQDSASAALIHVQEAIQIRTPLAHKAIDRFGTEAAQSWVILGLIYRKLDQFGGMEKAWATADSLLQFCPDTYIKQQLQEYLKKVLSQEAGNPLVTLLNQIEAAKTYEEKVHLQTQLIELVEQVYAQDTTNQDLKSYLAQYYGSLSWYQLFTQDFPAVESAARKGLSLNPTQLWINTNLAHSLLFQGRFEEARNIYLQFKGRAYDEENSWEEIFLQDLNELEAEGITHPDVKKIRKLLNK